MRPGFFTREWMGVFSRCLFALSLIAFLLPMCAYAQFDSAKMSGLVTDQKGAFIHGAEVEVRNVNTNALQTTNTNDSGFYIFTSLKPGLYLMNVRMAKFRTVTVTGIVLNVQDSISRNFELQVGSAVESVTVMAESEKIGTSGAVGTVIDHQLIESLPLNGRSFQSLILLSPGVTVTASTTNDYGQFSVNGQRASANYFTVDGVSANIGSSSTSGGGTNTAMGGAYPGLSAFGGTNNLVSMDALEEFKIQTSSYTAEFGRQPGGQVTLVTRSGTNKLHGTLFEYLRNDVMDARDYFNVKPLAKPPLRQNDFGGTLSGPIYRDKTFFFFSYEGQRLRLPDTTHTAYVPSLRVRSAAGAGVLPVLNAIPLPTGGELTGTTSCTPGSSPTCAPTGKKYTGWAPRVYSLSNPSTMDATSIRIDHQLTHKFTLFGRFNEAPSNTKTYSGAAYGTARNASTQTSTLGATWMLTPRLTNELRANYSRQFGQAQYIQATYGGAVPVDPKLLTTGNSGTGLVSFSFGGHLTYVQAGDITSNYQRQVNILDTVSLVKGAHQFKFGIDYRKLLPTYGVQNSQMEYFLAESQVTSSVPLISFLGTNETAKPRFTNFSSYIQDTWKVKPRLTVDFGLRWDVNPAPTEADGKMPPVVVGVTTGNPPDLSKVTLAPSGTPFYKTFYGAFAPRFGAAYQLRQGNGRETVLRGGFGVFYDLGTSGATGAFPLKASKSMYYKPFPLTGANAVFPTVTVPTVATPATPVTQTVWSNASGLSLPRTMQWNLAVEQSVGTHQSVSASYVGAAARKLLTTQALNSQDYATGLYPNPSFSSIMYTWNGPTSDYHSMQLQYKARFTRFQGLVNYTWSHAVDDVSTDAGFFTLSRGNADFDVRHNFSAALTYNLPSAKIGPVLSYVFSNWFVNGIVHAQSGLPVDLSTYYQTFINGLDIYTRPDRVPGVPLYVHDSSVPGGRRFNINAFAVPGLTIPSDPYSPPLQGNFGRNIMRELALTEVDFAMGRTFKFGESRNLQFKGEIFNIMNHPMFGSYDSLYDPSSTTFGVPQSTLGRSLGGLSSLYQMGGPRSVQVSLKLNF